MKEADPHEPSDPRPDDFIWPSSACALEMFQSEQAATPSPLSSAESSAPPSTSNAWEQASTPVPVSTLPQAATQSSVPTFEEASAAAPVRALERASTTLPFRKLDQSASRLPLSCVLAEDIALEWHEAVAIVQELAHQITRDVQGEPRGSVPDIADIEFEATGHLRVRLDPAGWEPAVRGLGYLIHQLFVDKKGPVNLHVIFSRVVSITPTIRTVADLTQELAKWERPHPPRLEKLSQLYERARRAAENNPAILLPREPRVRPAPETSRDLPSTTQTEVPRTVPHVWWSRLSSRQQSAILAATVAVALVPVILLARLALSGPHEAAPITPPKVSEAQPPAIGSAQAVDTVPPIHSAPIDRVRPVNSPRQLRAAKPASVRPRTPIPKPSISPPAGPPPVAVDRPEPGVEFPVISGLVGVPGSDPLVTAAPGVPHAAPVPILPADTTRGVLSRSAGEPVYTSGDPGVTEPVLIKPLLQERPSPGATEPSLGILDIVVDTHGRVESVRLRSPANRYRERWWLFTAKNWEFTPALKDGHPVKFLKRIAVPDTGPLDPG